mgnify:CR=1 FL=1
MNALYTVMRKELLDLFRDRKTIFNPRKENFLNTPQHKYSLNQWEVNCTAKTFRLRSMALLDDGGRQLLIGTFEAARAQNDKLASWNPEGPNWGAPDGCDYSLVFNQMKAPWNDVNLRYAMNFAIDRDGLNDIGYEGSQRPVTFAFSNYMAGTWLAFPGPPDVCATTRS